MRKDTSLTAYDAGMQDAHAGRPPANDCPTYRAGYQAWTDIAAGIAIDKGRPRTAPPPAAPPAIEPKPWAMPQRTPPK